MRRVTYAGGSFVTADDIASLLLEYAAALANHDRAAAIHVPAIDLPHGATTIEVLVGPASQLLAEPVDDIGRVPDGGEFVADIRARIAELDKPLLADGWEPSPTWDQP
jgi:hypothetical protein